MSDISTDETNSRSSAKAITVRLAALFVSGLAINWVSNLFTPGPVIVIGVVVAALFLLMAADSPKTHFDVPFLGRLDRDLLKFSLAAFLLGATLAGLWHLPFFPSQIIPLDFLLRFLDLGEVATTTSNYELGALASILILGVVALARRAPKVQVLAFGIAAISGNSLVLAAIDPSEMPLPTIIGWSACYIVLILLAATVPDIARLFREFFGIGRKANRSAGDPSSEAHDDRRPNPMASSRLAGSVEPEGQ